MAFTYYSGYVITPVSLRLWKSRGRISLHSMAVGIWGLAITLRCAARASHIITINIRRDTNAIIDPTDDNTFHIVMASG